MAEEMAAFEKKKKYNSRKQGGRMWDVDQYSQTNIKPIEPLKV